MIRTTTAATLAALAGFAAAEPFTVIGLPDTQFYSRDFPDIFRQQSTWTVDNADALDIRFVSHYGDVVQNGDNLVQWANADFALAPLLASDLPLGIVPGNHDVLPYGSGPQVYDVSNYLAFFGPSVTAGRPGWQGASPSGRSSYQFFEGGGYTFLHLALSVSTPADELEWAQNVVSAHRDKPVMITTHRYIQDADDYVPAGLEPITNLLVESGRYPSIWYTVEPVYDPTGMQSNDFFRRFVAANPNVFWVNCGHFHEQFRQTSTNIYGNPVHEVLADYQDDPNGGNGWLRIMRVDTANNEIVVDSYSPRLDQFRTADQGDFTLAVDFAKYSAPGALTFQGGILGYAGTRDTWINEDAKDSSYGNGATIDVDDDVRNNIFNDRETQALLAFDDLFTSTGEPGKIPVGRPIERAVLRLHVSEDHDNPFYDPDIRVHFMTKGWSEGSTWNSMNNGLSSGDDYDQLLGAFAADNNPDGNFARSLDVTAAVQRWANGEPNHGFALTTEIISGNDDGISIKSSENGLVIDRPALEVFFTPAAPCSPADIAAPLGVIDLADADTFITAFTAGDPAADLAAPFGVTDLGDIDAFISAFVLGCP